MPSYKLTYFNGRGRAEVSRLVLAVAGQKYEDYRLPFEEWGTFKKETPLGGLPLLTIDGNQVLAESGAIVRYLATKLNLAGSCPEEAAHADMILEALSGCYFALPFFSNDDEKMVQVWKEKYDDQITKLFTYLENVCSKNSSGYLIGKGLTFADLTLFHFGSAFEKLDKSFLAKYPKLKKLKETVEVIPSIAEWLKNRPVTPW